MGHGDLNCDDLQRSLWRCNMQGRPKWQEGAGHRHNSKDKAPEQGPARLVEETERQEWPMNKNHPLANLSKACSKDEWNKMGTSLEKFKILCKTKWIARTSILWRKTPILHVISLRKFRIIVSFIHVSSPTPSSSKDQRTKELTYPGPRQWLFRAQPISPGDTTRHPYIRLLGTRLPTSFLGLTPLTTGNLQYLLNKPIAHSLM